MVDGASMGARQQELLPRFAELTQKLRYVCRDLNVVITTADSRSGSTEGRFLQPAGQPMVLNSRATPAFTGLLQERLAVATDPAAPGTPLEAARLALSSPLIDNENAGFLRPVGDLWLVIATDRPDTSPQNVSEYLRELAAVKPAASSTVFVAGGVGDVDPCGAQADDARFEQASTACAIVEDGFSVRVDGMPVLPKDPNGTTLWTYFSNRNAIEFAQAPGENKQITITYHKASCAP